MSIDVILIAENRYQIGNNEYGYFYCNVEFMIDPVDSGQITEDDQIDICEAAKSAIINALEDKKDKE